MIDCCCWCEVEARGEIMGLNQAATGGRLAGTELVVVIGGGGGFTDRWW